MSKDEIAELMSKLQKEKVVRPGRGDALIPRRIFLLPPEPRSHDPALCRLADEDAACGSGIDRRDIAVRVFLRSGGSRAERDALAFDQHPITASDH